MTAQEATRLLRRKVVPSGSFLIRDSQGSPGNYTLSIKDNSVKDRVYHYRILVDQPTGEL